MYDFIIIGAGITGTMIARELSRYKTSVLVLEKENDVGNHATLANSAILHSGHDPKHGTMKARFCVEGNRLYDDLEAELGIPILKTGGLVLAKSEEETRILKKLKKNAEANKVPGVCLLGRESLLEKERRISDAVVMGLEVPTTSVTYPWEVALRAMENAIDNGVEFEKNETVRAIERTGDSLSVKTRNHTYKAKTVINAAGAFAGEIAAMIEDRVPYTVTPRRGEYLVLDRRVKGFISHTLYPVPGRKGKGTLLVPQVHGNILIGPTSVFQDALDEAPTTADGLAEIRRKANKLVSDIPFDKVIRTFAGIRASIDKKDFHIARSKEETDFIHVAGIDSPGLTAAPAIAKYVVETIIMKKTPLEKDPGFNPKIKTVTMYHDMDAAARNAAFQSDDRYGRVVCKCEMVTEADLINHIRRPLGADSVKALKKRARIGSGLCQGGFCEHEAVRILAETLGKKMTGIDYYAKDTPVLLKDTKAPS